jgi:hypothetical protein
MNKLKIIEINCIFKSPWQSKVTTLYKISIVNKLVSIIIMSKIAYYNRDRRR